MSEILQDTTKCIRTSTRSSGSELAAGLCRSSVSGRLTRPPNTSLQVPAQRHPERQSVKRPWARSCRCRVHAAAGRPKPLKERARGIPNDKKPPHRPHQTRARSLHPSPRSSRKALREHNRSSAETFAVAETPGVSFFPGEGGGNTSLASTHARHAARSAASLTLSNAGAHTPLPRMVRRWEQARRGRGGAGQGRTTYLCIRREKTERGFITTTLFRSRARDGCTEPNRTGQSRNRGMRGQRNGGFFFVASVDEGKGVPRWKDKDTRRWEDLMYRVDR